MEGQYKELSLEKIKAKIEELKMRRATEPDFGKQRPRGVGKGVSKEEREEFKKWRLSLRQTGGQAEEAEQPEYPEPEEQDEPDQEDDDEE